MVTALREELGQLELMNQLTLDEATSPESKAENKYDTRSLEASYLARGQGERLLSARRLLAFFEVARVPTGARATLCSAVHLESEEGERWVLIAPDGGGKRLNAAGVSLALITPRSPIGRALMGKEEGQEVHMSLGSRVHTYEVLELLGQELSR